MNSPREQDFFPLTPSNEGPSSSSSIPHQYSDQTAITRYKGVVLQPNGHWGAQIYVPRGRIWLGTFKSEAEAARAYDIAALRLHNGDSRRNFPFSNVTFYEPTFQEHFSTESILEMIRDGTYEPRLQEFFYRTLHYSTNLAGNPIANLPVHSMPVEGIVFKEMFQKELTPSDVGKLNRLVIPKKHAMRFFPPVSPDTVDGISLEFRDGFNRSWVFRYCYWKSSQSYVFTKGWNRFVKEAGLCAKDTVIFYRCFQNDGLIRRTFCFIDIARCSGGTSLVLEDLEKETGEEEMEDKEEVNESGEKKDLRLFGVSIR